MKHTWKKTMMGGTFCLVPDCIDAEKWLTKTKINQGVLIDPRRPRNINHHRKLFALLNLASDNWPEDSRQDAMTTTKLLGLIKIKAGYADPIVDAQGNVHYLPRSINFESMGQDEFDPFYNSAIYLIALALKVDVHELEKEST